MNKEEKYREEIFSLLENKIETKVPNELDLLKELFMKDQIEDNSLVDKIKNLL